MAIKVFSKWGRDRQKHIEKKAAKERKENELAATAAVKVPYKHVPTHAAVDALNGAPSSWKGDDRIKIMEQHHKRRSQMAISRTGSSLSAMSYAAGPSSSSELQPQFPRNSSYSSHTPNWFDKPDHFSYHNEQPANKRHKPSRGHSYHDSGIGPSPLASNAQSEEVSPVISSSNSTSSNSSEPLEIPGKPPNSRHNSHRPQPTVYQERDIFQRLHTSTTRKLGEAPVLDDEIAKARTQMRLEANAAAAKEAAEKSQTQTKRKSRFSFMGKKNTPTIAV